MIMGSHLYYLIEVLDEKEFISICKKFGKVMREAHLQILDPIWKAHPELLAEELGGEYKIDKNMHTMTQSPNLKNRTHATLNSQ
ncbi:hypothetical protein [Microbulbifer sp. ZKSA002]|uniref:hypothetical protein n=1 Tax=Microbulbifer sp. ZKSA002 TaxID=3243388 RepID=UPI004039BC90